MNQEFTLFVSTFTTLLAIINPLEVMPVYLQLLEGKDSATHRSVARRSCTYALLLLFFFLIFGTLLLRVFDVPLSMMRIVGGIILLKIGFSLFDPPAQQIAGGGAAQTSDDVAFVPLAMPLMFGPGGIATVLGMAAQLHHPLDELPSLAAIAGAIVATIGVTYLVLIFSPAIVGRIGPRGIDAVTRIVGIFVAAIGMGLIFQGVMTAVEPYLPRH
jgi:multiple antibiotic resistance protein